MFFQLRRFQTAFLIFVGLSANYMLRTNINIALVEMTNVDNEFGPYVNLTDYGGGGDPEQNQKDAEANVKSAFFIGYMITQVPGGRLSEIYGTKKVFGICMFLCNILAALTPVLSYIKMSSVSWVWSVWVIRVLQGLFEGVCYPSLHIMVSKWSPESEKGTFLASYLGGTFGTVITYPLCGLILAFMSWTWVFYITSIATLLWNIAWFLFIFDSPETDKYISEEEKEYIISTRTFNAKQLESDLKTPLIPVLWDIIKTPAVWVDMMGDFCNGFGLYVLLTEGPDFISKVLPIGDDIVINGIIACAPPLCRTIIGQIIGYISDIIIARGKISKIWMQKINATIGFVVPAAGMVTMSYMVTEELQYACIAVLAISFGFNGAILSGHIQNIMLLAPNRSGTLYGVTNGFGNISGFLVPLVKAWVVTDTSRIEDWRNLFFIAAALYLFIAVYFMLCGSKHVQYFNSKEYKMSTVDYMKTSCFKFTLRTSEHEYNQKAYESI